MQLSAKAITLLLTLLIIFSCLSTYSQHSDIIVFKKRNSKTIKTYFPGIQIHFVSIAGNEVEGMIKKIVKDSIYINIYDSRPQYTIWGSSFWDTVSVSLSKYHIKEIREIVKPPQRFAFIKNGFIFIAGGVGYAILHSVNALYLKEKIDPKTIGFSAASIVTGIILKKINRNTITLGKRHYLQYIPLN